MTKPIRGKVARVLNAREIAINVGTAKGVTVGMYFDVMGTYNEIEDPDTREVLGSLERLKVRVKITQVQEKLSLATTYRKEQVTTDNALAPGPFTRALMQDDSITRYETLSDPRRIKDTIKVEDNYVNVGDPVVQVIEDSEEEQEDADRTSKVSSSPL